MIQGYIAIGYMCNQACSFCPCSKTEKRYPIPDLEKLKKAVEAMIIDSHIDSIVVSGGEPTIHPDFIEFIKYLCEKDLKITILTNSERFSDEKFADKFLAAVRTDQVELITTNQRKNMKLLMDPRGVFEEPLMECSKYSLAEYIQRLNIV